MGRRIELPRLPEGETQEQLQELYSYLYQMADALNNNLAEIGNGNYTDEEMKVVREIVGTDETNPGMPEAESLKTLIIKTAQLIKTEIDAYNLKLIGTYEAEGKLGRYVRKTRLDVDVTPSGITQNYTFQDIIQGLKTYEVNAKNYIKTGYLRTENNIPIYGVAIGKDVVTFSEDGTETYNDGNKVAELTADELSFWQSGSKVAGYTGSKISFYSGNAEVMYIQNGKIYCNGDLEIKTGKTFKIVSGGVMDVDTNNFKLDSENKKMVCGGWTFDDKGVLFEPSDDEDVFQIAGYTNRNSKCYGLFYDTSNTSSIYRRDLYLIPTPKTVELASQPNLRLRCRKISSNVVLNLDMLNADSTNLFTERSVNTMYVKALYDIRTIAGNDANYKYIDLEVPYASSGGVISYKQVRFEADSSQLVLKSKTSATTFNIILNDLNYRTLTQNSSREIKHDIKDMESRGKALDKLRPVTFVYNEDPEEKTRAGLIYEEAAEVMPEICVGEGKNKAINYVEIIPMLLKEIQELRARVKALEEK